MAKNKDISRVTEAIDMLNSNPHVHHCMNSCKAHLSLYFLCYEIPKKKEKIIFMNIVTTSSSPFVRKQLFPQGTICMLDMSLYFQIKLKIKVGIQVFDT